MNVAVRSDEIALSEGRPCANEVRLCLQRMLSGPLFRDSLRLTRFLAFVVEETLAGKADRIKAYSVAVEALGRGNEFDPQKDPIVRVEAGRLRRVLARYYADLGSDDPVVIELPRGTYVPVFNWRASKGAELADRVAVAIDIEGTSERLAVIALRYRELHRACGETQRLIADQYRQIEAVAAEIETARQTLKNARKLRRLAVYLSNRTRARPAGV